ncbi:MAG: exodeoxyribonuclease III [Aestuariivirgaceae bacterium]
MAQFKIATWNINSVRLRAELVVRFLKQFQPDVLCLQETKCPEGQFPSSTFARAGYGHIAERGQSGYHGVAIVSRHPFSDKHSRDFCGKGDARHVSVRLGGVHPITIHSLYVPAGGDEPDPGINEKFAHKLAFLEELNGWMSSRAVKKMSPVVMTGDLNIAPLEQDVWSHKQLLKVVSHTPVETELLNKVQNSGRWVDVVREHIPADEKLYTWWSYRARDWSKADKGRRLDHIWLDEASAKSCTGAQVVRDARGWDRPSDHAPVLATLDL